ncbi:hypothetical protein [Metabacillus iocasae]|uniref:Uncharacterized protein n=1 Tax=Priestia iocasae TaxID=2291674 RepID=A0ABS2QV98_9BACI|nr:hypothetical protein [Metabacillus iocasae]MBM7703421.1 hypothetical protein [Metabacillus iocasae]
MPIAQPVGPGTHWPWPPPGPRPISPNGWNNWNGRGIKLYQVIY